MISYPDLTSNTSSSETKTNKPDFPFRYIPCPIDNTCSINEKSFLCMNPYLNRYAMPGGCVCSAHDARKVISSILGNDLLSLLSPTPSFSDCIRLLSYGIGILSAGDLTYYFGMDQTFMRSFLAATEKSYHNLIRYKSRKNFNSYHYYLFKPTAFPFKSWRRMSLSPISYAGKKISPRSIPHIYSVSLSSLMMGLWSLRNSEYYFEVHPEVSLGSYRDVSVKSAAEVTMDALCILRRRKDAAPHALICMEQDMGTENYGTLLKKLHDYSQTYYFDDKSADNIYILFSCNRLCAARRCNQAFEKKWYAALYSLIRQLLTLRHRESDVLNDDMLPVIPSLPKYLLNLYKRGNDVVLNTIHKYGIFPEMVANSLFGVPLQEIDQCILELHDKISDLFVQFLAAIGIDQPLDTDRTHEFRKHLPLRILRDFLNVFPDDTDFLLRVSYNKSLYKQAMTRHHGLAHAILSVMLLKRSIPAHSGTESQESSAIFLYPIYQGYSIYTVATPIISNYLPYMLWDRQSREISYLESCISSYLHCDSFTYSPLSPRMDIGRGGLSFTSIQDGAYFPDGRFRHYYYAVHPDIDGSFSKQQFCVEDLDGDTGAYCRAYLFLRYYCSPDNLHLIMLVDSTDSALSFYKDVIWGRKIKEFSQSPRCRVPLYAKNTYTDHSLSWNCPRLLFLEKGNSLLADKRLFAISEDGSVIYYR